MLARALVGWVLAASVAAAVAEVAAPLDLDADDPDEPAAETTTTRSELESVAQMTSEFWDQVPAGVKATAIWDFGYDGLVGARVQSHCVAA
jgi:hypothetical protein